MPRIPRALKIGAIVAGSLFVLAASAVYGFSEARLRKSYDVVARMPPVTPDAALVERGRHLAETRGCTDCHTADLGGKLFIDEAPVARVSASNLTTGRGGVGPNYTDADWERAIRHGLGTDGRALAIMPSKEYFGLSDGDVAALVAYLRSIPPVDRELPERTLGPIGRTLLVAGMLKAFAAESIDHDAPRPDAPPEGPTAEYGRYLAVICSGCHGDGYTGGAAPGGPPGAPPAANLTPHVETGIGRWSEADFNRALREGRRPDGSEIRAEFMPWGITAKMTADELRALWLYFSSLEPRPIASR